MKRYISMLMLFALFVSLLSVSVSAEQYDVEMIHLEDGSYIIVAVTELQCRATQTRSGSKSYTYYTSDGSAKWKATLSGTFTYNGSSATCTSSSCSVTIYNSSWYTISKSASKSSNTASASVTMGYKVLGVTTNQVTRNISLSCDKDGKLS